MMKQGVIPNTLMPVVQEALAAGRKGQQWDPAKLTQSLSEERIEEMTQAMDNMVCAVVTSPTILPVPKRCERCGKVDRDHPDAHEGVSWVVLTDEERLAEFGEDAAFIDWIDEMDKAFLVAYATGGTADAEKFREQYVEHLGALQSGQGVQGPAKRPARTRR